ncbi:NitT/TauT family transport system substrate-binding protein [Variovorax boronicumulans]|jgi:NitT/TauT family transport system substrate-binding protein|uniref:ABC transporter substrate-binding protein n=1 Tax=Variovorax boronicumulans TaxID=436515 RepID=UPI0027811F3B|nr:ABC transporter substrate-binding protein [Variovorax boronicumulans]MDQ0084624.1 NitT/TauT family transport system substrate-binding protein [Variovorax boronicumulans]
MLTRRDFGLGLGALGLAGGLPALAQNLRVMKVANTAAVNDPQQCFVTAGQHPKLNFYKPGGVDVEYVNMSNMTQALQSLRGGHVDFGPAVPGILLPAMAKDPTLDLVSVYKWLPRNANVIVVKPGSPIKSAADLAGKRIGVRSQGDSGIVVTRTMLAELGLKDDKCEYIAIGDGAPAGAAIDNDRVDAMVSFDTAAARVELIGTRLRYVPITPKFAQVGSGWICVPRKLLKEERKALVALFRGIAKSTIFAHNNLDAGIDLHWAVYPESRPKGRSEEEVRKELAFVLKDRKNSWMRRPDDPDQRIGASSLAEWKANIEMTAESSKNPKLAEELGDPNRLFTNELIDEINAFDKQAVVEMAKAFKL